MKDKYLKYDWYGLQWEQLGILSAWLCFWGRHSKLLDAHSSWHWTVGSFFIFLSGEYLLYTRVWFNVEILQKTCHEEWHWWLGKRHSAKAPMSDVARKKCCLCGLSDCSEIGYNSCGTVTHGFGGAQGAVRTLAQAGPPALLAGQEEPVPMACPQPRHSSVRWPRHHERGHSPPSSLLPSISVQR